MLIDEKEYDDEKVRKMVKEKVTKSRYKHILGVAYTAACLAMRYGVDMNKAYMAGLLHDCAKCIPDEEQLRLCREYHIPVTETEEQSPYLLHGKLGAYLAEHEYHVSNPEILHAIAVHTTGCPAMTPLEQIVFVADYIEPSRDKASNLTMIRNKCFEDLDEGTLDVLDSTVSYLKKINSLIDINSIDTLEYYQQLLNK